MAINLGAAYVDIVPSTSKLAPALRKDVEVPLAQSGKVSGERFGSGFTDSFTSGISSLASKAGEMITGAITTAGVAGGALLATSLFSGWDRLTTIQDSTAALSVILGDATKAAELLDEVMQVVTGTSYQFPDFAAAAQQMAGFGVPAEKIPGYLTAIAEAASLGGKNAPDFARSMSTVFGQIAASGQINLGDVWRISDTGVSALAILGNHFDEDLTSMKKLISQGKVGATEALDALAKGIMEGSDGVNGSTVALDGTMAKVREGLSGASGGFKSSMARFGAGILEPFADDLAKGFTAASGLLDDMGGKIGDWGQGFAESQGFKDFKEWASTIPELLAPAIEELKKLGPLLIPLAVGIGAIALGGLASALGPLGMLVPTVSPLIAALAALIAINPELREGFMNMVEVVGGSLADAFDKVSGVAADLWPGIQTAFESIADSLVRIAIAAAPALAIVGGLVLLFIEKATPVFLDAVAWGFEQLANGAESMGEWFPIAVAGAIGLFGAIVALNIVMGLNPVLLAVAAIVALVGALVWAYQEVDWFRGAVDKVVDVMQGFWDVLVGIYEWVETWWPAIFGMLEEPLKLAAENVALAWDIVQPILSGLWDWVDTFWPDLGPMLSSALLLAAYLIGAAFVGMVAGITGALVAIRGVLGAVKFLFQDVPRWLGEVFDPIYHALVGPFAKAFDWILNRLDEIVGAITIAVELLPGVDSGGGGGGGFWTKMGKGFAKNFLGNLIGFHTGGMVPGGRRQEVPAVLLGGEAVLSHDMVDQLNRGLVPAGVGGGSTEWGGAGGRPGIGEAHFHGVSASDVIRGLTWEMGR